MSYRPPLTSQLRDRITILRNAPTSDGMGGSLKAYQKVGERIPAKIEEVRGGEAVISMRLSGISAGTITVRASDLTRTLTPSDIVIDDRSGSVYDVKWVGSLDEDRRWITLTVETGAPEIVDRVIAQLPDLPTATPVYVLNDPGDLVERFEDDLDG